MSQTRSAHTCGVSPPVAERRRQRRTLHGVTLVDDYAWLRDPNWREAMQQPERLAGAIRAYLEAENAYTDAVMADSRDLQRALVAEMRGRMVEDDASVPAPDGDWVYYLRFRTGGQHPIFCRAPRASAVHGQARDRQPAEQILFDGDAKAKGHAYFSLGGLNHSPDHAKLGYGLDLRGSEAYTLRVRSIKNDSDSDALLAPPIENTTGDMVWSADSATIFFTTLDAQHRPCRVWRLALGADPADAELVYAEPDPGFFVSVDTTQSQRYILIHAHDHATSETRFIDAREPWRAPRLIAERIVEQQYAVDHDGDDFTLLTNADGAEDFKLVRAPIGAPGRANWHTLVEHEPGRLLLDHGEFADFRVRMERVDALPRIVVTAKASGADHTIAFDAKAYSLGIAPGYEHATSTLRFVYSTPAAPTETWDYDMASRERALRKRREIPSGFDGCRYIVRRLFATTDDGQRVPITVTHHKDTPLDGTAPCVLHGYGAYGIAEAAGFSGARFSLIDRGFVHAIAHVRGGTDRGYAWYRSGKLYAKPNTFSDFVATAQHLADTGYTRRGAIAAVGGSAGGMLVGAVLNARPDLFGAAIADVPFVDVLNTMLDDTLPLTPPEWPEWGNPRDDTKAFAVIRSYCPYQNVAAQAYPPILVIAGVCDPRVTYWEPAKWVAKLRATKTDANLVLLKTHMAAGHGGVSGRFAALDEAGLMYAFLLQTLGAEQTAS